MTTNKLLNQRTHALSRAEAFQDKLRNMRNQSLRASLNDSPYNRRMILTGNVAQVNYINDAGASNINATFYSLSSSHKAVVWIVNATEKTNYAIIASHFGHRIRGIVCLGKCHQSLRQHFVHSVPIVETDNMVSAIYTAQRLARPGQMVLFSPVNYGSISAEDYSKAFESAFNEL